MNMTARRSPADAGRRRRHARVDRGGRPTSVRGAAARAAWRWWCAAAAPRQDWGACRRSGST